MINPIYFFLWWVMWMAWIEGRDGISIEGYGYVDGYDDN